MPACQFCHQLTNRTYRSDRIKDQDISLIHCCTPCSEGKEYLTISSILKPLPVPIEQSVQTIHEQYLIDQELNYEAA